MNIATDASKYSTGITLSLLPSSEGRDVKHDL